jgi:hypothetical protein
MNCELLKIGEKEVMASFSNHKNWQKTFLDKRCKYLISTDRLWEIMFEEAVVVNVIKPIIIQSQSINNTL